MKELDDDEHVVTVNVFKVDAFAGIVFETEDEDGVEVKNDNEDA
jgi:hypothetical protein